MLLPAYVDRGSELVYQQPYAARDARQDIFFLRGDRACLDAMFDRYFTTPSGGEVTVRPMTSIVALSVLRIDAISSSEGDDDVGAGIAEWEVAVWTVGVDVTRQQPVMFAPYLFVDSGMAMAAGREVYGLPKQDGRFAVAPGGPPYSLTLDVLGSRRFDPSTPFTWQRLLRVAHGNAEAGRPRWASLGEASRELGAGLRPESFIDDAIVLLRFAAMFASGRLTLLALKQFRDVAQPDRACYQAITESYIRTTALHGGGLLSGVTVDVEDLESAKIVRELGIRPGPQTPLHSIWMAYDFVLETGALLWQRP